MKKVIFLLVCIIYSINCLGQRVIVEDVASVQLPEMAIKLSKAEISDMLNKEKYRNNHLAQRYFVDASPDNVFHIDDIIIKLHAQIAKVEDGRLASIKQSGDLTFTYDLGYSSTIKTIKRLYLISALALS